MAVGEHNKPVNSRWVFELFETLLGRLSSCTEARGLTVPQAKLIGRLRKPQRLRERTAAPEDAKARLVSLTTQGQKVPKSFLNMVGPGGPGAVAQIPPQTRRFLLDVLGNVG